MAKLVNLINVFSSIADNDYLYTYGSITPTNPDVKFQVSLLRRTLRQDHISKVHYCAGFLSRCWGAMRRSS